MVVVSEELLLDYFPVWTTLSSQSTESFENC